MSKNIENIEPTKEQSSQLGSFGETAAAEFLRIRGYRIAALNFRTVIGRNRKGVALTGEIDIVAIKGDLICFVEVKSRSGNAAPESAVTLRKQRQITRTARAYQRIFDISNKKSRFDVITVVAKKRGAPLVRHLKNFWSPEKFRKKSWSGDYRVIY